MQIIIKDPVLIFFNALKKESDKIEGEVCEVGTVLPCFWEWVLSPLWKWNWTSSAKFRMTYPIDRAIPLEEIYVGEREAQKPKDIG